MGAEPFKDHHFEETETLVTSQGITATATCEWFGPSPLQRPSSYWPVGLSKRG